MKHSQTTKKAPSHQIISKEELIHLIAGEAQLSLDETRRCVDAFTATVSAKVAEGHMVRLIGFGSWHKQEVAEHTFIPIRSSERTTLPAHHKVRFHAGAELVSAVRGQ